MRTPVGALMIRLAVSLLHLQCVVLLPVLVGLRPSATTRMSPFCWLCGGQEPLTTKRPGRLLDTLCWSAIRCHHRLLPDAAAKTSDRQRMLRDVESWKDDVRLRRMGSEGIIARADRKDAKGIIIERAGYNDQSQIGDDILLTKRPFCAHAFVGGLQHRKCERELR